MTASPAVDGIRRATAADTAAIVRLLEGGFGRPLAGQGYERERYQFLLDALDRGEASRFVLWPGGDPVALVYMNDSGTIVPAGDPAGAPPLAAAAESVSWRVLIGDEAIGTAVTVHAGRGIFRRAPRMRQQRLMVFEGTGPALGRPRGLRAARAGELERLTEFACALHVEDQMGPPISRAARASVRARMRESVLAGATWVVEEAGRPVAKVDVALRSRRRGAQIAGVYVDVAARARGIATAAVAAITRDLIAEGLPSVTLHVRSDNTPALRAYARAGFADCCPWILALR